MPDVTRLPRQIPADAEPRLRRLRRLSWLLDQSFTVGGKRIGLDPLIGLVPGLGDWLGAGLSLYVVYEAMRLGLPWSVLVRMLGNVVFDSLLGAVPVAGDLFDFFWQANTRNLALVDRHYRPHHRPRSLAGVALFLGAVGLVLIALLLGALALAVWLGRELWHAISAA